MVPHRPKVPNRWLADLISESALPSKGVARRVVARGRERGLNLSYDHNSVRRWLGGEQPLPPTPHLIADVLSEALGRHIVPADCGFHAEADNDAGLEFDLGWVGGVAAATTLYRSDIEHRRALAESSYSAAIYPTTAMRWLTAPGIDRPVHRGRARVGTAEISAVRSMTTAFRDLDNRVGGGRIRSTVVQYLHSEVAPLLRGSYTEDVGKELFSIVAELTKNVGWMAYDSEAHGVAQRYLVQALRMAKTASDSALAAEVLAAMGHQATYVGRSGEAVDLARAAQVAARRAGLPVLVAECLLIEAHGHAGLGDAKNCDGALLAGEQAFGQQGPDNPEWLSYFDEAYLAAKTAHCFRALGDEERTGRYAQRSLRMNPDFVRGRAFNLLVLAGSYARTDPLEAVRVGHEAVALAEGLESGRSRSYVRDLSHRLHTHSDIGEVAEFRERARQLTWPS